MDITNDQPLDRREPGAALAAIQSPFAWFPGRTVNYIRVTSDDGHVAEQVPARFSAPRDPAELAQIVEGLRALPRCRSGCPGGHPPTDACTYDGQDAPSIRDVS